MGLAEGQKIQTGLGKDLQIPGETLFYRRVRIINPTIKLLSCDFTYG